MRAAHLLAIVTALAISGPALAAGTPYVLLPGHIDLAKGPDGNTVILAAPDGLIVVDTGRHPEHATAILDHARSRGKPVAAIVNTHWHFDHTTGNRDLRRAFPAARLVATDAVTGALDGFIARGRANAVERLADPDLAPEMRPVVERALAAMDDRAALVAPEPVAADGPLDIAGRRLEVRVAPRAATEADLWLVVPNEDLAVVGDLVVAQSPFFDTGCEEGWRQALDAIEAAQWSTLIPGHGAPMTRADFTRWRVAFGNWLDCAASDRAAAACTDGWMADARGFYSAAEADSVRQLQDYYVTEVLRAPADRRMAYCREG